MPDLPKINPTVPSGNGSHTPLGAKRILSCSFKMNSWVVAKSNPVLPLVAARRSGIRLAPGTKAVVAARKTPVGDWGTGVRGAGVHAPLPVSLRRKRLAVFILFGSTLTGPMFAFATSWPVFTGWVF